MKIHINRFLGIAPKISAHLLNPSQAQVALNAKLWSQGLRPVAGMGAGVALSKSTGVIQTVHRYANTWLAWTQDVNAVKGPANDDSLEKLYFTGTDKPRVTTNVLYDDGSPGTSVPPASWVLGIPTPTTTPTQADAGAGVINATVSYVFTFVRKFTDGWVEESAPSPPSATATYANRQANVTIPNNNPIAATFADYGVTHRRIYRSEGGSFFFVAEIPIGSGSPYLDNIATAALGDAVNTIGDLPWPDDVVGLVALANGCVAAFKGKQIYISEPKKPHAYRLLNLYTTTFPIVGLGAIGNTIVAITSGQPEIGRGVDPAAYSFRKWSGIFPCTSKRSIGSGDFGVLWSTPRGMAVCDGVSVALATADFITKEEWERDFYPTTIHGAVHDGRYYGWFKTGVDGDGTYVGGGFVLDKTEQAFLTTLGDYVYAAHVTPDGDDMYVVQKEPAAALANYIYPWEADPTDPFAYDWKSKRFISEVPENLAFAQVVANYGAGLTPAEIASIQAEIAAVEAFNDALVEVDGAYNDLAFNETDYNGDTMTLDAPSADYQVGAVTFSYWADGTLRYTVSVINQEPFPLPPGFVGLVHEFQVSGALQVDQVTLATSIEEL